LCLYCGAYGIARWRKCIVMDVHVLKDEKLLVRRTAPGVDARDDWKGHFKNKINPILFIVFRPLELIEDQVRGGGTPLPGKS
jgi:transposase